MEFYLREYHITVTVEEAVMNPIGEDAVEIVWSAARHSRRLIVSTTADRAVGTSAFLYGLSVISIALS